MAIGERIYVDYFIQKEHKLYIFYGDILSEDESTVTLDNGNGAISLEKKNIVKTWRIRDRTTF